MQVGNFTFFAVGHVQRFVGVDAAFGRVASSIVGPVVGFQYVRYGERGEIFVLGHPCGGRKNEARHNPGTKSTAVRARSYTFHARGSAGTSFSTGSLAVRRWTVWDFTEKPTALTRVRATVRRISTTIAAVRDHQPRHHWRRSNYVTYVTTAGTSSRFGRRRTDISALAAWTGSRKGPGPPLVGPMAATIASRALSPPSDRAGPPARRRSVFTLRVRDNSVARALARVSAE